MNGLPSVLIVEDEAIVAADLERAVRRKGYWPVGIAATGAEAINMAHYYKPDVILMDYRLQGDMNGLEAVRRIRTIHVSAVVYVTAMRGTILPELHQGSRCVAKPFILAELCAAIEEARAEMLQQTDNHGS